ncbi:MAG: hypothetical protein IJ667_02555 [Synergistaceae bacterium]|nr:hypothetical protein [Synergistaceae bacterium]
MAKIYIRNMEDGARDYPLKDGKSIYLPPKGKPVHWAEIAENNFSPALAQAELRGFIQVKREAAATTKKDGGGK